MNRPRVLLIGPVPGLSRALKRRKVPFVVWSDTAVTVRGAEEVLVEPYATGAQSVESVVQPLLEDGWFTHVIAGRPVAEMTAARARRVAGARAAESAAILRYGGGEAWVDALADRGLPVAEPGDAVSCSVESFVQDGGDRFHSLVEWREDGVLQGVPAAMAEASRESVLDLHRRVIELSSISWGTLHLEVHLEGGVASLISAALCPPESGIVELLSLAYDFDAWNAALAVEMDEAFEVPSEPRVRACAWLLRGPIGAVIGAEGADSLDSIPGVASVRLVVRDGIVVPGGPTPGMLGHVLFQASSRESLEVAVDAARRTLVLSNQGE